LQRKFIQTFVQSTLQMDNFHQHSD